MVKISQNNDQLLLSLTNEEEERLGSLIDALTDGGLGRIAKNSVVIFLKDHIFPIHQQREPLYQHL